jgi:hypothetical protein
MKFIDVCVLLTCKLMHYPIKYLVTNGFLPMVPCYNLNSISAISKLQLIKFVDRTILQLMFIYMNVCYYFSSIRIDSNNFEFCIVKHIA